MKREYQSTCDDQRLAWVTWEVPSSLVILAEEDAFSASAAPRDAVNTLWLCDKAASCPALFLCMLAIQFL